MENARENINCQFSILADESFKDHELINMFNFQDKKSSHWVCKKPNTSIYSFNVVFIPRTVIICGDIGDAILSISDQDSFAWLTEGTLYQDYILSKVQNKKDQYYPELAKELVEEIKSEQDLGLDLELDIFDFNDEHEVVDQIYNLPGDWSESISCCYYFTPNDLWCYLGLKKFVNLYKNKK